MKFCHLLLGWGYFTSSGKLTCWFVGLRERAEAMLVTGNWPGCEYLHSGNWHRLKNKAIFLPEIPSPNVDQHSTADLEQMLNLSEVQKLLRKWGHNWVAVRLRGCVSGGISCRVSRKIRETGKVCSVLSSVGLCEPTWTLHPPQGLCRITRHKVPSHPHVLTLELVFTSRSPHDSQTHLFMSCSTYTSDSTQFLFGCSKYPGTEIRGTANLEKIS